MTVKIHYVDGRQGTLTCVEDMRYECNSQFVVFGGKNNVGRWVEGHLAQTIESFLVIYDTEEDDE